jgi:hypothetical protein
MNMDRVLRENPMSEYRKAQKRESQQLPLPRMRAWEHTPLQMTSPSFRPLPSHRLPPPPRIACPGRAHPPLVRGVIPRLQRSPLQRDLAHEALGRPPAHPAPRKVVAVRDLGGKQNEKIKGGGIRANGPVTVEK